MTAGLDVRNLTGGYGAAPVLHGVDLRVGVEEVVGLLGANGAGKSTLLRALSGSLPTCRGEIRVGDRSLAGAPPWVRVREGLAHVPEGRHVFAAMTVRENLEAAALVRRERSSFDQAFALFPKLDRRQKQLAGNLSGGEQQMLAIARALVTRPSVLVIDEMSAGLAPVLVEQLVDGLSQLRGSGVAVLLVEQSPHFIADAVDRVYLLEHGRVVGEGRLGDLGGPDAIAALYLGV